MHMNMIKTHSAASGHFGASSASHSSFAKAYSGRSGQLGSHSWGSGPRRVSHASRATRASAVSSVELKLAVIKDLVKDEVLFMHPDAGIPEEIETDCGHRQELEAAFLRHSYSWHCMVSAMALVSAVMYVFELYVHRDDLCMWCDMTNDVVGVFFLLELVARWYIAEDRLLFFLSFRHLLDIAVLIPTVLQHVVPRHTSNAARVVFSLQFLRIVNVIRFLRAKKHTGETVSRVADPSLVRQELRNLILSLLALILAAAAIVHVVERYGSIAALDGGVYNHKLDTFHDSIYFLVITLTTVGYGDIAPLTLLGKVIIMGLVVTSIVVIPRETTKISEMMTLTSEFAGSFTLPSPHVVVVGHIDHASLRSFLDEFFHEAHGRSNVSVALLSPVAPSKHTQLLLAEGGEFYGRVQYLEGSAMEEHDLERVEYKKAIAAFFLTNKGHQNPMTADQETTMRIRSCKNFHPSVPVFAQTLLEESIREATASGADYLICISAIKTHVLAISSVVHGFSTLFLNLFRNEAFTFSGGHWMKNYCHGVAYEIYTIEVPVYLHGKTFGGACLFMHREFGAMLFGVKRTTGHEVPGDATSTVFLNPYSATQEFVLRAGDVAVVFAKDETIADEVQSFTAASDEGPLPSVLRDPTQTQRRDSRAKSSCRPSFQPDGADGFHNLVQETVQETDSQVSRSSTEVFANNESPHYKVRAAEMDGIGDEAGQPVSPAKRRGRLGTMRDTATDNSAKDMPMPTLIPLFVASPVRQDRKPLDKRNISAPVASPAPHNPARRFTGIGPPPLHTRDHIIVICPESDYFLLASFVSISRSGLNRNRAIVAMAPIPPREREWRALLPFNDLHVVNCTGKRAEDWSPVLVETACSVVILSTRFVEDDRIESDMMGDYDALSIYFSLRAALSEADRDVFTIVELINRQNMRYFQPKNDVDIVIDDSNDYVVPAFAAGHVYSNTGMDSLLCQVFYNPDLLTILQKFLHPAVPDGSPFVSSSLYSVPCPHGFVGKTFDELLEHFLSTKRWLPIGLYHRGTSGSTSDYHCRSRASSASTDGGVEAVPVEECADIQFPIPSLSDASTTPVPDYVFLCPPGDTVLSRVDDVFVFADRDPNGNAGVPPYRFNFPGM
eukprot:TRINITY_DN18878_c0_g1_i1.p1 TRINITY_DN18878_c0_g1~~TRINITY_DN18878_c0_g1_i1.p1  ORF type:complete len:1123 (+),score=200.00 TRINITY_DN18878_c0_g1_i1:117-3485(+)